MPATDDEATESILKHRPSGLAMAKRPGRPSKVGRERKLESALLPNKGPGYRDGVQKATAAGMICVHCQKGRVNRPKHLCWHCYYTPGVRDLYPSTSKYARRGIRNFSGLAPLADAPTLEPPGTDAKIKVMAQRAKDGKAVFHPADARYANDERTLDWLAEWAKRNLAGAAA